MGLHQDVHEVSINFSKKTAAGSTHNVKVRITNERVTRIDLINPSFTATYYSLDEFLFALELMQDLDAELIAQLNKTKVKASKTEETPGRMVDLK